jgi:hypothetical protein
MKIFEEDTIRQKRFTVLLSFLVFFAGHHFVKEFALFVTGTSTKGMGGMFYLHPFYWSVGLVCFLAMVIFQLKVLKSYNNSNIRLAVSYSPAIVWAMFFPLMVLL